MREEIFISHQVNVDEQYQDAIWKRNLYTCWSARFLVGSAFQFLVPFIPMIIQDMGLSNASLDIFSGFAISIPGFFIGLMAPFWGYMADIFGHKIIMIRAFAISALLFFLFTVTDSPTLFIILRIMQGLFTGIVASSIALVSAGTPSKNQNKALRILASSSLIASTVVPAVSGSIILAVGLTTSLRVGSIIILISGIGTYFLIRDPITRERRKEIQKVHIHKKKHAEKIHYTPEKYKPILTGCLVISGLLNLMRISLINIILLAILRVAPTGQKEILSSTTMAIIGVWALLNTYFIPHIAFKSKKSRFTVSLISVIVLTTLGVGILSLEGWLGFVVYIMFCAIVLGISDGVDIIMQEVIGHVSYTEHKGKVFGRLTLVGGIGRFSGAIVLSSISGFFGIQVACIVVVFILVMVMIALRIVRIKERRIQIS